jgi:EmrB/QacA subfamily drug resistance transporter
LSTNSEKNVALIITTLGAFLTPYMSSAVNIALPAIGNEFQIGAVSLSWIATAYLLAAAVFLVPFGRLADLYGRKKIYAYGMAVYTLAAVLLTVSSSDGELIAFRVLEGLGAAMISGTGVAILTSVFPIHERGKALGINLAATYFGLSMGPFLGGFLTGNFGWRSVFLVNVPLGALVVFLIAWMFKGEWSGARGEKFDMAGSALYGLAIIAVVYGISLLPSITGAWAILTGIVLLIAFTRLEARSLSPVLNIHLFRSNRIFALSNLAAFLNYSSTYAVAFFLSLYLQYIQGFSPQAAGTFILIQPAMQAIFSPFAGRLSDRVEPRIVASAGMLLTVVGLAVLTFLRKGSSMNLVTGSLLLLGVGFAFFSSPNTSAIMGSVEKRHYGVASGMVGTMRFTGQMFSQGIAMLVSAVYIGSAQIVPSNYSQFITAMNIAFAILMILCTLGIFASLARGRTRVKSV